MDNYKSRRKKIAKIFLRRDFFVLSIERFYWTRLTFLCCSVLHVVISSLLHTVR